uniref:N-acetyltransferase domain-containing protein n=1 Tax=Megaselia scalaris TaxID=36166 RepID=T1GJA5_MEGSC
MEGKGVGKVLAKEAIQFAKAQNLKTETFPCPCRKVNRQVSHRSLLLASLQDVGQLVVSKMTSRA